MAREKGNDRNEWLELKKYIDDYGTQEGLISFLKGELGIDINRVTVYRWLQPATWNRSLTPKARRALTALRQRSDKAAPHRINLRIAHSATPYALSTVVAYSRQSSVSGRSKNGAAASLFDRYGVTVEWDHVASGTEALHALRDGRAQLALADWALWDDDRNSLTAAGCEPLCQVARVSVTGCARWQWFMYHAQTSKVGRTASLMWDPDVPAERKPKFTGDIVAREHDLLYGWPNGMSFGLKVENSVDNNINSKEFFNPQDAAVALKTGKIHCFLGPESWVVPILEELKVDGYGDEIERIPSGLFGDVNTHAFIRSDSIDPAAARAYLRCVREASRKLGVMVDRVVEEDWEEVYGRSAGKKDDVKAVLTKAQVLDTTVLTDYKVTKPNLDLILELWSREASGPAPILVPRSPSASDG